MSCAQPQAEAVSLEQKASFLLKIYIRPLVSNLDKIGPVVAQIFLFFIIEVAFLGRSSSVGGLLHFKFP